MLPACLIYCNFFQHFWIWSRCFWLEKSTIGILVVTGSTTWGQHTCRRHLTRLPKHFEKKNITDYYETNVTSLLTLEIQDSILLLCIEMEFIWPPYILEGWLFNHRKLAKMLFTQRCFQCLTSVRSRHAVIKICCSAVQGDVRVRFAPSPTGKVITQLWCTVI